MCTALRIRDTRHTCQHLCCTNTVVPAPHRGRGGLCEVHEVADKQWQRSDKHFQPCALLVDMEHTASADDATAAEHVTHISSCVTDVSRRCRHTAQERRKSIDSVAPARARWTEPTSEGRSRTADSWIWTETWWRVFRSGACPRGTDEVGCSQSRSGQKRLRWVSCMVIHLCNSPKALVARQALTLF